MRSGGANYRDEDRLVHMMRTIERIKSKKEGLERSMMCEGDDCTELIIYNLPIVVPRTVGFSTWLVVRSQESGVRG